MISILVAYTKNHRVIGKGGEIPWNLPSERLRFKEICKNRFIIMGRKSFDEIGHGLPYCTIIIISRTLKNAPEGCLLAKSLENGIELAKKYSKKPLKTFFNTQQSQPEKALHNGEHTKNNSSLTTVFQNSNYDKDTEILIAGGGEIYRQALSIPVTEKLHVTKVYATEIEADYQGDTTFPPLENYGKWKKTEELEKKELEVSYKYVTYER